METIKNETPNGQSKQQKHEILCDKFYQDLDIIRGNYIKGSYNDIVSLFQLRFELTEKYGAMLYRLILTKHPLYIIFVREFEFVLTKYLTMKIEELEWRVRQSGPAAHHWQQERYTHIQMNDGFGKTMLDNRIRCVLVSKQTILNEQDKYPELIQVLWEFENIWMGQINFTPYINEKMIS
jgi:hypothetical protein